MRNKYKESETNEKRFGYRLEALFWSEMTFFEKKVSKK